MFNFVHKNEKYCHLCNLKQYGVDLIDNILKICPNVYQM